MFVPTIRVVLGLFTGFPVFAGFTRVTDEPPCAQVLTLGLLVFTSYSGEEILGLTLGDLPGMSYSRHVLGVSTDSSNSALLEIKLYSYSS